MSQARDWYRWKRRGTTEWYLLWGLATATYGVGDIVTTTVLVYATPGIVEANPFVHWGLSTYGPGALVAMKLGVFLFGYLLSWRGLQREDALLYYAPPLGMIAFGLFATIVNVRLVT